MRCWSATYCLTCRPPQTARKIAHRHLRQNMTGLTILRKYKYLPWPLQLNNSSLCLLRLAVALRAYNMHSDAVASGREGTHASCVGKSAAVLLSHSPWPAVERKPVLSCPLVPDCPYACDVDRRSASVSSVRGVSAIMGGALRAGASTCFGVEERGGGSLCASRAL